MTANVSTPTGTGSSQFLTQLKDAAIRHKGAAWRVSLKGASQCLSWGRVEFAPLLFPRSRAMQLP
jgi:hypothetical protein